MATFSSILAWRIPWTGEPGGLHTAHRVAKSRTWLSFHFLHTFKIIALDNCKFFILFFLFRFISRMAHPQGSPRELVMLVFAEWIYGPPRALLCPGNTETGWDFVPDAVWNIKQNACAAKPNKIWTKRTNPSFHHKHSMWRKEQALEQSSSSFWAISIWHLFEMVILSQNHLSFKNSMHEPS